MIYSAQDARKLFAEIISRAAFGGEPAIITRSGKKVAAIISFADYEQYLTYLTSKKDDSSVPLQSAEEQQPE
jgi:prevent-host-death family protein